MCVKVSVEATSPFNSSCTEKVNACVHKLLVSFPRFVQYSTSFVSAVNLTSVTTPRKAILASAYIVSNVGNGVAQESAETDPWTKHNAASTHKKRVFFIEISKVKKSILYNYIRKKERHCDNLIQTNVSIMVF